MIILGLLAPFYWPLAVPALIWALACLSYGIVLGIKHRDFCAAASGYASMVMQVAWSFGHWREIIAIRANRLLAYASDSGGSASNATDQSPLDTGR